MDIPPSDIWHQCQLAERRILFQSQITTHAIKRIYTDQSLEGQSSWSYIRILGIGRYETKRSEKSVRNVHRRSKVNRVPLDDASLKNKKKNDPQGSFVTVRFSADRAFAVCVSLILSAYLNSGLQRVQKAGQQVCRSSSSSRTAQRPLSRMTSFSFVFLAVSLWLNGAAALTNSSASSIIPASELASLNNTVKGRLFRSTPFASPCFSLLNGQPNADFDDVSCAAVQANYGVPEFRTPRFGAYMEVRCGPLFLRLGIYFFDD